MIERDQVKFAEVTDLYNLDNVRYWQKNWIPDLDDKITIHYCQHNGLFYCGLGNTDKAVRATYEEAIEYVLEEIRRVER